MLEQQKMDIRIATIHDAVFIAQGTVNLFTETVGMSIDLKRTIRHIKSGFEREGNPPIFLIATLGGEDIASCYITQEFDAKRAGNFACINTVFVRREFRGKGVFRQFFNFTKNLAEQAGFLGLMLYVDRTNAPAISIYEKYGFDFNKVSIFEIDALEKWTYEDNRECTEESWYSAYKEALRKPIHDPNKLITLTLLEKGLEGQIQLSIFLENLPLDKLSSITNFEVINQAIFLMNIEQYFNSHCGAIYIVELASIPLGLVYCYKNWTDYLGADTLTIYDVILDVERSESWSNTSAKISSVLFESISESSIQNISWMLTPKGEENIKSTLLQQGFDQCIDSVMFLEFNK